MLLMYCLYTVLHIFNFCLSNVTQQEQKVKSLQRQGTKMLLHSPRNNTILAYKWETLFLAANSQQHVWMLMSNSAIPLLMCV